MPRCHHALSSPKLERLSFHLLVPNQGMSRALPGGCAGVDGDGDGTGHPSLGLGGCHAVLEWVSGVVQASENHVGGDCFAVLCP